MPEITRYPHYHQAENVVTNHVMVMLRELYRASPVHLETVINGLLDEKLTVGPRFTQQISGTDSIPDGLILQEPMAVFIETKLGSGFSLDQLDRHCKSIVSRAPSGKGRILFALTAGTPEPSSDSKLAELEAKYELRVLRKTFANLLEQLSGIQDKDPAVAEGIEEFSDFIFAQGLVPRRDQYMVGMLTGKSWRDNLAYGVYYEPAHRNAKWQHASFIGLYHDKHVSHVGRIVAAVEGVQTEGAWKFEKAETGTFTDAHRNAITGIVSAAQGYYPGFQGDPHRYYIVDQFSEIDFRKVSPGGMMGHRYFDIQDITQSKAPPNASGPEVARLLDGKQFT